ncbi:uncharacterized mitochondrial protein AtMg00810-like [Capsicum annuum]|uniref:uncharacterized mitochondrial protein AtMg00810-like n=1 Tax=Capsicum annuum TaxID=4072 RepID=UPI0007BF9619|nr:uncharacterized mitochondrial protein AtMg00810-like [Capsicum annuum]
MENLYYFLSIKVHRDKDGLFLNQSMYESDLLKCNDMHDARAIQMPLSQKHCLHYSSGSQIDAFDYQGVAGALQYFTLTRPDISHTRSSIKCVLRYIKGTSQLGLRISTSWSSKKQVTVAKFSAEVDIDH